MRKLLWLLPVVWAVVFVLCWQCYAADVTLGWDANTETDLAGYRVYYGTQSRQYAQPKGQGLDAGKNTTFTVKDLAKGPAYYFAVTAYDTEIPSLESDYSNEVSTNFAPTKPAGVKVTVIIEVTTP